MNALSFIAGLLIGALITAGINVFAYRAITIDDYNIPSNEAVDNMCKAKGYDSGWLSSNCQRQAGIQCHKKIFDLDKYECITPHADLSRAR